MGARNIHVLLTALATFSALRLDAQEMVGPYRLVPALPRPGAAQILDNDRGTVWDVIYPPGMPTGMHRHPSDFVGVELVETLLKVTTPDGQAHTSSIHRGQMYMQPKGLTHIEEGVVGHPQRNTILIELKELPGPHVYQNSGPEQAGFAADGARKVTDNARVILWDVSWAAGSPGKSFFQSRDIFLVPVDPGTLSITSADEPPRTLPVAGGQVVFLAGGHTRTIQSIDGTIRVAVVELK